MEQLLDNDLIYGAMFEVSGVHMTERYNTALEGFGLPKTKLDKFVIDAAGYSPEIALELKDEAYLNPHGINRRFIILSPEQESLPVVNQKFSSTYDFMMAFYQKNAEALRTLTLKDVVFGEIENSTYRVDSISDLLSIREVEFNLRTGGEMFKHAGELQNFLDEFYAANDSWQDTELMNSILERGRLVGDIRYNNIVPRHTTFQMPSFWTDHFDGVYVFQNETEFTTVMGDLSPTIFGDPEKPDFLSPDSSNFSYHSLTDKAMLYKFLLTTGRIIEFEPGWLNASGLLDLRSEILVRTHMAKSSKKMELRHLSKSQVRNWIHENFDELSQDGVFPFLAKLQKSLQNNVWPDWLDNAAWNLKLMTVRPNPKHPDRVLVARLLSQCTPFDFFTKFAVNKQGFYDDYSNLAGNLRDYAIHKITNDYFPSRRAYWETLFAEPEE